MSESIWRDVMCFQSIYSTRTLAHWLTTKWFHCEGMSNAVLNLINCTTQTNEMNKWNVHRQAVIWNVSETVHGAIVLANKNYRSQAIREFNCHVSIETKNMHNTKSQVTMTTASGQSLLLQIQNHFNGEHIASNLFKYECQIWLDMCEHILWNVLIHSVPFALLFLLACFFLPSFSDDGEIAIDEYEVLTPFSLVFKMHGLPFGCMIESTHTTDSCIWK